MNEKKPFQKHPERRNKLFDFAFCPNYDEKIKELALSLADKEDVWDFSDSKAVAPKYSILKSYIEHYFGKLESEHKICFTANNKYACFNTGLLTNNLEEIMAFFEENKAEKKTSPFFFKGFFKKSHPCILEHFHNNFPQIANFFDKLDDLIFNPNCELIPDIDHIIEDNIDRFPSHMQGLGNEEITRRVKGAIDEVKIRVKTNYKLAVPQYFGNRIQLLLPLCLTPGSRNPDLALVVHKINDSTYSARTCLTLKMAYNNARLIVKPQSSWLKP